VALVRYGSGGIITGIDGRTSAKKCHGHGRTTVGRQLCGQQRITLFKLPAVEKTAVVSEQILFHYQ